MILKIIKKYFFYILILALIKNYNNDKNNYNKDILNQFHQLKKKALDLIDKKNKINIQEGKSREEIKKLANEKDFYESHFQNIIYFANIVINDISDNIINQSIINEIENVLHICTYNENTSNNLRTKISDKINDAEFIMAINSLKIYIAAANSKLYIEKSILNKINILSSNIIEKGSREGSNMIKEAERSALNILEQSSQEVLYLIKEINKKIEKEKIDLEKYINEKEKKINKIFEKIFLSSYKLSLLILSCFFIYTIYNKITKTKISYKKKYIKFIIYYFNKIIYISFFILNLIYIINTEKKIKNIWQNEI